MTVRKRKLKISHEINRLYYAPKVEPIFLLISRFVCRVTMKLHLHIVFMTIFTLSYIYKSWLNFQTYPGRDSGPGWIIYGISLDNLIYNQYDRV